MFLHQFLHLQHRATCDGRQTTCTIPNRTISLSVPSVAIDARRSCPPGGGEQKYIYNHANQSMSPEHMSSEDAEAAATILEYDDGKEAANDTAATDKDISANLINRALSTGEFLFC